MSQQTEQPRQRKGPSWLPAAVVLLCSAVFGYAVLPQLAQRSPANQMLGTPAPDFSLPVLHGGDPQSRISLSGLAGNVVVLDFWASWCKPCVQQARILSQVAARHDKDEVVFVGINTADRPERALAFAESHRLPYPSVYDSGEVADAYGAHSLPTLIVIDSSGRVTQARVGVVGAREIESAIASAASAQAPR